jgi:hypothetical protein
VVLDVAIEAGNGSVMTVQVIGSGQSDFGMQAFPLSLLRAAKGY